MRTRVVARTGAAASAAPADDFTAFVQQWTPPVVKALSATLGDPDLARDATQEALTRAWLRWPDVLSLANPPGWLYRVGLNWARSRYRRMRR
nr:RNA polymerase sigma factor [Euzebyales bacterium]